MSELTMPTAKSNELQNIFFNDCNNYYMPETSDFKKGEIEMFVTYRTETMGRLMVSFTVRNDGESSVAILDVDGDSGRVYQNNSVSISDLYSKAMEFVDAQG